MRISNNEVFSDLVGTSAPSLAYTVYNPVDEWARSELAAYQRGTILVQIADSGVQCFAPEVIALWYKRRNLGNIGDWAMITALPAIGTAAPVSSNDDLCALPVGSVYVKSDGITCVQQLYLKVRQDCGSGGCNDWIPLLLTVTRAGTEVSFNGETNTLNLPVGGNLASLGDGEYKWTGDSGALPYSFYIPSLTDNTDGSYTYDPRDGGPTITFTTDSGLVIPADISAVRRPWVEAGNATATNASNVTEAATIFHTGVILRGVSTQGTTGTVGAELTGNNALGAGNHVMTASTNGTIGAGSSNENKSTANGFVGGGVDNVISGAGNPAGYINMGILAGTNNGITDSHSSVIGGGNTNTINTISTDHFIGAGESNNITGSGNENVIVGGNNNEITGGGGNACIVGGNNNKANANLGQVLGGTWNEANGAASTALGLKAQASHNYAFLINTQPGGDPNTDTDPFNSAAASEFAVRCDGIRFFTNLAQSAGMTMAAGASSWSAVSDERAKNNIQPLDVDVLAGYKTLIPVSYFMGETIGAGITAQNYYESFPFLERKTIGQFFAVNQAERDGIQDAAIKQLVARVEWLEDKVLALATRLARYEGE